MIEPNGNGNGKKPNGAPKGNRNAAGNLGNRTLKQMEKDARRRADELLNLSTVSAVRTLRRIMKDPNSTNFDKRACAEALLDRKIPKMTQERVLLQEAPKTLLDVPNLGWPPPLKVVGGEDEGA